ncbi:MAG: flagellar hook-length control protein FliK [Proteobacteria bacterium]|nr:flagellar hook-length control protein FliK [Pseudomonadota bacterium]
MNSLHNIASLHRMGATNSHSDSSGGGDVHGLQGFLDELVQAMQGVPDNGVGLQAAGGNKDLKEKIAASLKDDDTSATASPDASDSTAAQISALLQENNLLPESLQKLPRNELTEKIAALLQTTGTLPNANDVKPSLTSDLAAQLATQIQAIDTSQGDLAQRISDLTKILNKTGPGNGHDGDIIKILALLQAQQQGSTAAIDPAILQRLKDKVTQLLQSGNNIGQDDIAKLKADIIQSLKDQGLDRPAIQNYLTTLVKSLKESDGKTDKQLAQDYTAVPAIQLPPTVITPTTRVAATTKSQPSSQMPSPPLKSPLSTDNQQASPLVAAPKQDVTQQRTNTPSPDWQSNAAPKPQMAVSVQPSPQQNLSTRIAGFSVNPDIISALASGDGNFKGDSFSNNNGGQPQDMINNIALLKPVSVDTINTQNFTNYLSAARGTPSAVTQMVNIQLQRNINAKIDTMTLQLEPADLGRLDIKLKFDKEGGVKAHLTADKPETLTLLQRDSHHLEKVLQQSGLDIDEKSLSFDLRQNSRQQNFGGFHDNREGAGDEFSDHVNGTASEQQLQAQIAVQSHGYITRSGVNIMV